MQCKTDVALRHDVFRNRPARQPIDSPLMLRPQRVFPITLKDGVCASIIRVNFISGLLAREISVLEKLVFHEKHAWKSGDLALNLNDKVSLKAFVAKNTTPNMKTSNLMIGCLVGYKLSAESDIFYINALAVRKEHSKTGLGSALLERCFEAAKSDGCQRVYLNCLPKDKEGSDLFGYYRARGFRFIKYSTNNGYMLGRTI